MAIIDDLKCNKCGKVLNIQDITISIMQFGFVYLSNKKKKRWFGFNCPACDSLWLNIRKYREKDIGPFINKLCKTIESYSGSIVYNSFPYSFESLKYTPSYRSKTEYLSHAAVGESYAKPFRRNRNDTSTDYCSFNANFWTMAPISLFLYDVDEEIEKLVAVESETGVKIFPRYIVYDPLYTVVQNFCWEHRLFIDYISPLYIEPLPIDKIMSSKTKQSLSRTFKFMNVLDTDFGEVTRCMGLKFKRVTSNPDFSKLNRPFTSDEDSLWTDQQNVCETIWSNFTKDYVQSLLDKLAEKFIDEYISLSKRVKFTYADAWNLLQRYLKDLYNAIPSRKKCEELKIISKEGEKKRVQKAENKFSGVKIISDNSTINEFKINISRIEKVRTDKLTILLLGEEGTGKDLFAQAFHEASGRTGKFVKFDCGAVTESLFASELFGHVKGAFTGADKDRIGALEASENGTLFIDEVGNLPMSLQSKFLRVLQNWEFQRVGAQTVLPVNAMVIFATNKDLDDLIVKGEFMSDLYSRMNNALTYRIPSLKERKEDIPLLIDHFIDTCDESRLKDRSLGKLTITPECIKWLSEYHWPGNIRQLEGTIHGIVLKRIMKENRSAIDLSDLPPLDEDNIISQSEGPKKPANLLGNTKVTDDQVRAAMQECNGNKTHTAKKLGVTYDTILRHCKNIDL